MKKAVAIGFFLFICFAIYCANTKTPTPLSFLVDDIPYGDKVGHFMLFGILALLVNLACGFWHFRSRRIPVVSKFLQIGSIVVLAFALAEELSQYYFPSRTLDFWDAVSDISGVGFFTWFTTLMLRSKKTHADDTEPDS